ncbi:MAG TPA: VOC family protein [bacterium]|nr:VOC family protein [bacterium]
MSAELRLPVSQLDHVTFRVPDLEAAAVFYSRVLGLGEVGRDPESGSIRLSAAPRDGAAAYHQVVLYPGEPAGLEHYGLAVPDEADLARAASLLQRRGIVVDGPRVFEAVHGPAVRLRDADGYLCELTAPLPPTARPSTAVPFRIVRLTHINLRTLDPARSARWWQEVMDLRLSDLIPETFYWLRCRTEHATIALVRAPVPRMHHIGFEIASWGDMRRLLDHFVAHGVKVEYGPGRHGPGNSIFVYVVDPWQIRWEFQCESAPVKETSSQPGLWDPVKGRLGAVNIWGPAPPESFLGREPDGADVGT